MANASVGKRSLRQDFDHAEGDMPSNINFMMIEKDSKEPAATNTHRTLTEMIGQKEILALLGVVICIYLINGEYANFVCTALTSIPPAIFSYRVLMNSGTTKEGYHSILFYWTVYGVLALVDQFVGQAQGYNLCKGGLLGTIFFHAMRTNPYSMPKSWQVVDEVVSQMLTSILTKYDNRGFAKESNSSNFVPRSPTMTQFSDESEYMIDVSRQLSMNVEEFDFVEEDLDLSTACSFAPTLDMQSTQKITPAGKIVKNEVSTTKSLKNQGVRNIVDTQMFASMSAMTITAGGQPDIVTVPQDRIDFSFEQRELSLQITNVSSLHVMFALKTNADTYLIAAPTTGVLLSGKSMTIRVGVTERFFENNGNPEQSIDKLAIDYTHIPQEHSGMLSQFSHQYFQTHNRRRCSIRVFYH